MMGEIFGALLPTEKQVKQLGCTVLVCIPLVILGIWKVVEIILWVWNHDFDIVVK